MQLYALTRENTRRTGEHYWNLQKLNGIDQLPKVGESLSTANWTMACAMDAYDTLHEDGDVKLDLTQPFQIVVQAEGMTSYTMTCESDWAITVLMYD
jgi:hypothetical protein